MFLYVVEQEGCHDCAHDTQGIFDSLEEAEKYIKHTMLEGAIEYCDTNTRWISKWEMNTPGERELLWIVNSELDWHENGNDVLGVALTFRRLDGTTLTYELADWDLDSLKN